MSSERAISRLAQYADALVQAEANSGEAYREMQRTLARTDLFYLLAVVLGRRDVVNDWLMDRCNEVQSQPDGYLDLWAREHYKSTIITFGLTIQEILRDPEVTVGIFSHTRPVAKAFLTQIMRELEANESLKTLFPEVLWADPRRQAPQWSLDGGIVVKRETNPKEATVEAHGLVDGQPTSRHFSLLVYDDVVTLESVTTSEQIAKVTNAWAMSLNLGAKGGRRRMIGTRYHFNDTYRTVMERQAATPRIHTATNDGGMDGTPVFLSAKQLAEKRREMGPYIFGCQMLQNPKADDVQGFDPAWREYWNPSQDKWERHTRFILVDPANEKKRDNDYTVMTVWGLAPDQNFYLIHGVRDRLSLTERTSLLFSLHRQYRPLRVGYERYGMQADIDHIRDRQEREGYRFQIVELGGNTPKNDRIRKLVPLFEQRRVILPRRCLYMDHEKNMQDFTRHLEDEYDAFPVSLHDDIMDCCARIIDSALAAVFPIEDVRPGQMTTNSEYEVIPGMGPARTNSRYAVL